MWVYAAVAALIIMGVRMTDTKWSIPMLQEAVSSKHHSTHSSSTAPKHVQSCPLPCNPMQTASNTPSPTRLTWKPMGRHHTPAQLPSASPALCGNTIMESSRPPTQQRLCKAPPLSLWPMANSCFQVARAFSTQAGALPACAEAAWVMMLAYDPWSLCNGGSHGAVLV